MIKTILLLPALFVSMLIRAQSTDTANSKVPESWKKFHIAPRVAIGLQRSFFTEIGLSLQKYLYEARHGFVVYTAYTAFEWIPATSGTNPVYGVKLGYEIINNGGGGGIEIKYLSDSEQEDVMITPRLGFGIGLVNIFYGYNFSTNKYPFPKIRKHQFTLVINTNLLFYHMKKGRIQ